MSAPAAIATDRLERLRAWLAASGVEAVIVSTQENLTYVSGFRGSAGFGIVSGDRACLVVDFRYVEQAAEQAPGWEAVRAQGQLLEAAAALVRAWGVRRVGVEGEAFAVAAFRRLQAMVDPAEVVPLEGLDRLRWRKDPEELARVRRAAAVADAAFLEALPLLRPGATEREVAAALEYAMRRRGADGIAFDTIVASGPRSALPHGRASDRVIGRGEFVIVDFGAVVEGYRSDCTRTVVTAPADARHREIYALVLAAQEAALAALRPGMTGRDADAVARERIVAAGYGEAFGHGLGHGVGLAVHEGPRLSPRDDAVLPPGAVVTVEPGVYVTGWGGCRIEDLVVLTDRGCEVLTQAPKALVEVVS
ncbi:MAG: Xaa-Pro peptidase family protein [Armatimonadota bacterium]|nr:Xaa-Pro peptidase family protein [Armatimonadota bacterium]MDR7532748.1 Xaa-Pro peptidase family protein [Armatimonadota bacterium]MDR7537104.1 Xaa-Pro peptidase family protein [Armatimonadota bacterium]